MGIILGRFANFVGQMGVYNKMHDILVQGLSPSTVELFCYPGRNLGVTMRGTHCGGDLESVNAEGVTVGR